MKTLISATVGVCALATAATIFASLAIAAPSGPSSIDETVNTLKADGYDVVVVRTGAAQMSQCSVRSVRPGQEISRTDSGNPGDKLATNVVSKTVYVDIEC